MKETFKVLQNVKKTPLFASENSNLRTPENASISIKNGSFEPQILNGAHGGSLLELFNKILHPVLTSSKEVLLYFEIENFINGLEK